MLGRPCTAAARENPSYNWTQGCRWDKGDGRQGNPCSCLCFPKRTAPLLFYSQVALSLGVKPLGPPCNQRNMFCLRVEMPPPYQKEGFSDFFTKNLIYQPAKFPRFTCHLQHLLLPLCLSPLKARLGSCNSLDPQSSTL